MNQIEHEETDDAFLGRAKNELNGDVNSDIIPFAPAASGALLNGDFIQLETDGSYQRTLEQTFTLPTTPSQFFFDFASSTSLSSATAIPLGVFPDSFAVSLFTASSDYFDILVFDIAGEVVPDPSDGIEAITGALPINVAFDPTVTISGFSSFTGGFSVAGRISLLLPTSVRGQEATLYLDLFDEQDGAVTRAAVDNVSIAPVTVPAPATWGLMIIGWVVAGIMRSRIKS